MKGKSEFVGMNLLMIAIVFFVVLFFGSSIAIYQVVAISTLVVCWQALAIYNLHYLSSYNMLKGRLER